MEPINDPAGRFVLRVAGGVLSWAGVGFLALLVGLIYAASGHPNVIGATWIAICAVLLAVGTFCALVGFRLFLHRPNRYGSILSPLGWQVLGGVFAALACATVAVWATVPANAPFPLTVCAVGGLTLFSAASFQMARQLRRR